MLRRTPRVPILMIALLSSFESASAIAASSDPIPETRSIAPLELPPVFVDAEEPPPAPLSGAADPKTTAVQVETGFGAQSIDPYRNELGVELQTMERLEELSSYRRADPWWLMPAPWEMQLQGDFAGTQKLRARTQGPLLRGGFAVELGGFRDRRDIPYNDNRGTIYNSADDGVSAYSNRNDSAYARAQYDAEAWSLLADLDTRIADAHAGPLLSGRKSQRQAALTLQWDPGKWRLTPYFQARSDQFDSSLSPIYSNTTQDHRFGLQAQLPISPIFTVNAESGRESLTRNYTDGTAPSFERIRGRAQLNAVSTTRFVELNSHARVEGAADKVSGSPGGSLVIWDAGLAASSTHQLPIGAQGRIRRFSLLPTPTQRFGDGALLQGTQDLPPETGSRASLGPWWTPSKATSMELDFFFERGENAPVFVAVSPNQARTLPIGGVWARGLQFRGRTGWTAWGGRFGLRTSWVIQEALNDAEINWQRGQDVPGRPSMVGDSALEYARKGFKTGATYLYKSSEALDLGGMWFRPEQHRIGAFFGYGQRGWEARLVASNLFTGLSPSQSPVFEGSAGPNLLEPEIVQPEIKLQWEVIL